MTRPAKAQPARKAAPRRRRRWLRILLGVVGVPALAGLAFLIYYYVVFSRLVDARLHGERERTLPQVFARPLELRAGQALSIQQLVDRLNDLSYTQRAEPTKPGEFSLDKLAVTLRPRGGTAPDRPVRARFRPPSKGQPPSAWTLDRLEVVGEGPRGSVTLEPPVLTALIQSSRQKRRQVPLKVIPDHVVKAVLAIEDKRFYEHPGVDPIRMVGALVANIRGEKPYLEGGSTLTQQLVRNVFLAEVLSNPVEKSYRRKLLEQFMAIVLERRASKDEILELYLNEVYLGQRGSFAIHGVAEAARLFFGKDVSNLSVAEAATIAGVIQSPPAMSPFSSPNRSRDRRNVVLDAMVNARFLPADQASAAAEEPLTVVARALDAEAPYFVDLVGQTLAAEFPGLTSSPGQVDVHTTLDLHLQRLAQDAVREGLTKVDELLKRKRKQVAQAALIAVDPRSGEILALVGGRSYNQSQFNRAVVAKRQPGSAFKPFVYLAAFERQAEEGLSDLTPATVVVDEPTTFVFEDQPYAPGNYEDHYEGAITLRRALAKSLNNATVKVAEATGYDRVAELWKRTGVGTAPQPYPSIALGVFEATPFELATAYTLFPNLGELRSLRSVVRIVKGGTAITEVPAAPVRSVARPEPTYLVLNLMRAVLNEGTGEAVRASGFALDAAGKTGTTNDLRDAWFVGFTPELLTVVWVGFDDNQPIGLSGSQAALPIWLHFTSRALAGHPDVAFQMPEDLMVVEIDRDTGKLAEPGCPRVIREVFLPGTEPTERCALHRF